MEALIDLVAPSLAFFGCYWALARRAEWPGLRTASFAAGLAVLVAGQAVDDVSLPVHMAGHGVVVALAAPLLVLGRPVTLLLRALPRPAARELALSLRSPWLRTALWPPLAFVAFVATQLAFHLTPLFGESLSDGPLHDVEHLLFLVTALWLWTVCLAVEPLPHRWPPLARAGLLMAAMMLSDIGSVKLMVDGEAAAGAAMTVSMMPLGLGAAALLWASLVREERRAARREVAHATG
ncbi:MAG TPA: cytochrome c oxidase assembly protein [Solirubrobacterales bacterium]|jgi:putative membrane protein|nr:cytochrome c oxidase assembly protein [Solirubrobacterales bacterium]